MKNVREVYYNGSESDFCLREYSTGSRLVNVIKTDTPTFKNSPLNSVVDRDSFLEGLNFSLKAAQKDCNRNTLQFGMGLASGQSHTIPTTHYETQTFEGVALPQMLLGSNNYSVCRELLRATAVGKAAGIPCCQDDWCQRGTPEERERKTLYVALCEHFLGKGVRFAGSTHVLYPLEEMDREKAIAMYLGKHTICHGIFSQLKNVNM